MHRTAWFFAFALTALACVGSALAFLANDRRAELAAAETKLNATAWLLEEHATRALEAGERAVRAALLATGDPAALHEEGRPARLHLALRGLIEGSPHLGSLWVLDADGIPVAETWAHPPTTMASAAHRPYFQAHRRGERDLHIGQIAFGPSARRARFTLSLPLLTAEGGFAGVVVSSVFSDYFAAVFAEAGLGEGARLTLVRADGAPLAVWPVPPGLAEAGPESLAAPPAHGRGVLTATRRPGPYPVILTVSIPKPQVLAPWRARALASGGAMLAIVAAIAGLILLGLRGVRQERRLVATLEAERAALEQRVAERTKDAAQSEARLRDTLESMTDAYVALDHDFRVADINAKGLAMDGRPGTEILGRLHGEAWPGSVGTPVEAALRRAMEQRVPVRLEHRYVDDRHDAWLDIRIFPTATGLALFYADIGERKRAEAALREAEERRRLATEGARVGIWEIDLASGQGQWSAEAVALFGIARDRFTAGDWTEALDPRDRARAAEAWRRAVEEGAPYEVEFRAVAPAADGGERWLLSRGQVERDAAGRPVRGSGVMLEVTDRVRAEARTREALAALHAVYDTAPIGLCVLDTEGRFLRINARLAEINGLPVEAHLGRTVREILPGIADAAEDLHRLVMQSGEPVPGVEIAGETPARPGVRRVWEEHWYPMRDAEGRIIGVNVVVEEVTERKAAEQRQFLLAREVDHRAKNALTMVQSVLRLTRAEDPRAFASAVEGRVAALARAQGLLAEVRWTGVDLHALLAAELSAFLPAADGAAAAVVPDAPGLHLEGPPVTLLPAAAQPVSMIVHELATNATKYGALSAAGGRVALSWWIDPAAAMLRLRWAETGGPPVAGAPRQRGFGSRVIETLVGSQLGGQVTRHWAVDGLVCEIALPLARAVATEPERAADRAPARQPQDADLAAR